MNEILQTTLLAAILFLIISKKPVSILKKNSKQKKLLLDSSGVIDGRIIQLSRMGFITSDLIVPQFILKELQLLADGNDPHKRERARFGLDVIRDLQKANINRVLIERTDFKGPTDDRLIKLAKKMSADIYTTDFNLNKLANIEGIGVLNINELVQNIRSIALPGEHTSVKILQKGSSRNQGIGYLEDGTMIVVENSVKLIGKTVNVEITRIHQTEAGKMLFAQLLN